MAYWRYTRRMINGRRRKVKVLSGPHGTGRVRIVGSRNSTDANRRGGLRRKRGYYNHSDNTGKNY